MRTLLTVLAVTAGCDAVADPTPERDLVHKLFEIRDRMHARFAATNGVHTAIAYGDLDRARNEARTIAALDEPEILPQWKPYVDNVQAAALEITKSKDSVDAAKRLATLGWRCAQCHEAVPGAKTAFPKVPSPSADPKLAATMAGHQWATARMWEGLVGPSAERWTEGAVVLARAPLTITAEADVPGHGLGIADDVARLRLFAARAPKLKLAFDRAELYGQLLATCANCHHTIRDR
jgi:cytochrome c553